MKKVAIFISLIVCIVLVSATAFGDEINKSWGQNVYAAMTHNCFNPYEPYYPIDPGECAWSANTRLIIRNLDKDIYIYVDEINMRDPDGADMGDLLDIFGYPDFLPIAPLASVTFALPHGPVPYWSAVLAGRPSLIVKWTVYDPQWGCCPPKAHPPMISSAHVIVDRLPEDIRSPKFYSHNSGLKIEGLTISQGVVLEEHDEPQEPQ